MKKILFKKLLSDYVFFLVITLISTGTVIWIFQAVNFLDIMIEDGRDYLVYIKFSLLNFPKILSKIFLFILFFTIFYVTIKYEENNELIIFWSYGINKIQIVNLIFYFSFFLICFKVLLTSVIVPHSQDMARSNLRSSTVNFLDNFVKPKKFNDTIKGLTIYAEKKNSNGIMQNLYLKKDIRKNEFQITYANKGEFKQNGNKTVLILYNGATISSKDKNITNISFSKSDFSLTNLKTNTTTYKKTQELSSSKLIKCVYFFYNKNKVNFEKAIRKIENCNSKNIQNIFKELYKRFVIPLYIPVLSFISLFLIILSKENSNYKKMKIFTFVTGFVVLVFAESTIRIISKSIIQNLSLSSIPIILTIFLYFFFKRKFRMNFINN